MKKEVYRGNLPHFQQPGQDYFVTWILKNSVPKKAVEVYSKRMEQLKNEIDILKRNNADTNAPTRSLLILNINPITIDNGSKRIPK